MEDPGDGRPQAGIPDRDLSWGLPVSRILRVVSFHHTEWLVRSAARAGLGIEYPFGEDTLAYFTQRLDPR